MYKNALFLRTVGFVASLIFTLAAYFLIVNPDFFHLEMGTILILLFAFAICQFIAQLTCFFHIWREKGLGWNLGVFVSTLSLLFIIIAFSIWIMDHLDYHMMMMK